MNDKRNVASEAGPSGIKKLGRIFLFCAGSLVLLIALFYAEEDLRGWSTWNSYRHKIEAKGVKLDFKDFVPKTVADEENFAATPFIKAFFAKGNPPLDWSKSYSTAKEKINSLEQKDSKSKNDKGKRSFVDLSAWETAFGRNQPVKPAWEQALEKNKPAHDPRANAALSVLEGLRLDEAIVTELREASKRSSARYPVIYNMEAPPMILLPHLGKLKAVVQHLQLRACSELAAGQTDKALEDVKLMLYVSDSLKEEPFVISYLVRLACFQITLQPVWEGLAEHRWADAQLQELQSRLEHYDFAADLKLPMESEQASGLVIADMLRKKGLVEFQKIISDNQTPPQQLWLARLVSLAIPRGWYYLEQANLCKLHQEQMDNIFNAVKKDSLSSRKKSKTPELDRLKSNNTFTRIIHHRMMAGLLVPSLEKMPIKAATAQTAVNEAALACALERSRLANGKFPESLESLAPQFITQLPNDVVTGEPYKYSRSDKNAFLLYSAGWNKTDDGGVPGKTLFDADKGDWVWQYPAK